MRIKYDPEANAAYIYLTDIPLSWGIVDRTQPLTDEVNVDWMKDGTLYGIEVLSVDAIPVIECYTLTEPLKEEI